MVITKTTVKMVSCQVRAVSNERVYQLSCADQRDSHPGFKVLRYRGSEAAEQPQNK